MAELGFDLNTHESSAIDELPVKCFDFVISMGCEDNCPVVPTTVLEDRHKGAGPPSQDLLKFVT